MEDNLKSIKLLLDYYDEEAKHSHKELTIKVNKPKDISEKGFQWSRRKYAMTFSFIIPEHIHSYLIGKSVPASKGIGSDRNQTKSYAEDFPKTINRDTVEQICEAYYNLTQHYIWLKGIDKAELKKVIFFSFENDIRDYKSDWNGLNFGKSNQIKFKYAIGYVSQISKNEVIRYNHNKECIDQSNNRGFYNHKFVEWSEEREIFFHQTQLSFENIINRLNKFESELSEESIDKTINGGTLLLS
jgi:hypothetical protein